MDTGWVNDDDFTNQQEMTFTGAKGAPRPDPGAESRAHQVTVRKVHDGGRNYLHLVVDTRDFLNFPDAVGVTLDRDAIERLKRFLSTA